MNEKKVLELEEQTSEALLALKKARAVFRDLCSDCRFGTEPLTEFDLHYMHMNHDDMEHKGYVISDYLCEAIDLLESADFSEVIED